MDLSQFDLYYKLMNLSRNTIAAIVAALILALSGLYLFSSNQGNLIGVENKSLENTPENNTNMESDGLDLAAGGGTMERMKYFEFSEAGFEGAASEKRVLFFYANWCPTCRPTDADLSANMSQIPDGAVVIRVNYNDPDTDSVESELAKKYGVTYQHTFVQIDSLGEVVTKWNGGKTKELLSNIK